MLARNLLLFGASRWRPEFLGSQLLAFWDAERSDLITQSGGLVSSWRDVVGGYDAVQSSASSKPAYSATSFNGRPGVTFDGTDDEMTLAPLPAACPINADASELWAVVDQLALPADTGVRFALSYGQTSSRILQRGVTTGVNRAGMRHGGATPQENTVDFSGRHVIRGICGATTARADIDGASSSVASGLTPATTNERLRLGASAVASAGVFWNGRISAALVTLPLSGADAALLYAYFNRRL